MVEALKPRRGGFLRVFGCAWFIREFLLGHAPYDSPKIDPIVGAPQSDIFYNYKMALHRVTALDRATRQEERQAKLDMRNIDPDNIEKLAQKYLSRMGYKGSGCRYHSFVTYFATLRRLRWVEPSGGVQPSAFQGNYPNGQPRIFYRLTKAGREASNAAWANPQLALYGKDNQPQT